MALNTIHRNKRDIVNAYNITQDRWFKCEILNDITKEKVTASLGLDMPSVKLTIQINGHSNVLEKNHIRILNEEYIVSKIASNYDKTQQFKKRSDYDFFNGKTFIFLE